ncbi:MAG TPA: HIT family protein, partial [Pseudomonas sp.]|nr:HIT family protein [Pseudomonas sp.]
MSCVFCAIADGDLPAHTIHADENFLVLLDI